MRARAVLVWLIAAASGLGGCAAGEDTPTAVTEQEGRVRYVALGDSYTIGTSVAEPDRWPNQLVGRIEGLELVANLGVNGHTSGDLIDDELPQLDRLQPELVSVLVGVNDVVQGVPDSLYAGNVAVILEELLTRLPAGRIVCIATPDYTLTPQGAGYGDPAQQSDAIVRVNAILREACEQRGIAFVPQIFEISQEVLDHPSLVADDGLHPSGDQYRLWVDAIAPIVAEMVRG